MILFPHEWTKDRQNRAMAGIARAAGAGRKLWVVPLSFRDHPETEARVAHALSRARRQPKSALGRMLKRLLLRLQYNGARRHFARHPDHIAVAWNGLTGTRAVFLQGARDAGAGALTVELAPFPGRVTLDPVGLNAESAVPRDAEFFRDWAGDDALRRGDGWRALGRGLTARAPRRSDVAQVAGDLPDTPFLFVPLQVPSDTQLTLFAGWTGGMDGFLQALTLAAAHLPPGWHLRVKEHPTAREALGAALAPLLATGRAVLDNATDSLAQMAAARGVVSLNSSMALQAFYFDKPVLLLGRAYFAMPGLVSVLADQAALNAGVANPGQARFDPDQRACFMNWLDQVYYPPMDWETGQIAPDLVQARIAMARRVARGEAAFPPPS